MRPSRNHRRTRAPARVLSFGVLAAAMLCGPDAGAAPPEISFTVRPAHPDYDNAPTVGWLFGRADPGERVWDAVRVENRGSEPLDLVMYPADAAIIKDGAYTVEAQEAADQGIAGWVTLERTRLTLDPGKRAHVDFAIEVPEGAGPGDYTGAVVARTARPLDRDGILTHLAVGARLYFTVQGILVKDLRVGAIRVELDDGRPRFLLPLRNAGNTILQVRGTYTIEGIVETDTRGRLHPPVILAPGASVTREVKWPGGGFGGPHLARFVLTYGAGKPIVRTVSFGSDARWPLILTLLLLIGAVVGLGARTTRIRMRSDVPTASIPTRSLPAASTKRRTGRCSLRGSQPLSASKSARGPRVTRGPSQRSSRRRSRRPG